VRRIHFYRGKYSGRALNQKLLHTVGKRDYVGGRWTTGKKITYLLDGVMSYSYAPLRAMSVIGLIFALVGFLYAGVIVIIKLTLGTPPTGWSPLMVTILVMGGLQMLMMGVIGEYLWRTLAQVRKRDAFVIEEVLEAHAVGQKREP